MLCLLLLWSLARSVGDVTGVSADYPDRVYALCPVPFAFGAAAGTCPNPPTVAATGSPGGPAAAVLNYSGQGVGVVTFPQGRFEEETIITGTKGRIKILKPSHHPTKIEIYTGGSEGSLGSWGEIGVHGYVGGRDGWNEPGQHGVVVDRIEYPLLEPAGVREQLFDACSFHVKSDRLPRRARAKHSGRLTVRCAFCFLGERGMPAGSRWDPLRGVIEYKGWSWGYVFFRVTLTT